MIHPTRTRKAWLLLVAVLAIGSLVATACGGNDESSPTTTGDGPTTTGDGPPTTGDGTPAPADGASERTISGPVQPEGSAASNFFGTAAWPCGPGDASGATHQGVTDDTITIGLGDDRGFTASPNLNAHQTEAVVSFIKKCNELGGINGREIEGKKYDAAFFAVGEIMREACEQVFMLVGSGFSLDGGAEKVRVGCDLGAVPAWAVSADFAHGPFQVNAVPNPADQNPMSIAAHVKEIAAEKGFDITKSGALAGDFSATRETWEKVEASYPAFGYEFIHTALYNPQGESSWDPFIKGLKDAGVEVVYFTGSCPFFYQAVRAAAASQDFNAMWIMDANFYDGACSAVNTGNTLDNSFVRMVFIPFEEASSNKATQDFIDVLKADGKEDKDLTLLGMQAVSSFLLWATGAAACGSELTRDCVLEEIGKITEWTGHGLHVPTNPAGNEVPVCGILVELKGTEYVRAAPQEPGKWECADSWRQTVETKAVTNAKLDENRKSTLHTE